MSSRIVICVLFIISATQAFPSSNVESANKEPACLEKLAWYGEVLNNTKKMYDEYLAKLSEIKFSTDALDKLNIEKSTFQSTFAAALKKYDNDTKNVDSVTDTTSKEARCQIFIQNYRNTSANLTESAKNLKTNVLNITSHSETSKESHDVLDKALSRTVNFLFLTDISKNLFRNASVLAKQSAKIVEDEIALEKEWKIQPNGELVPVENSGQDYDATDLVDKETEDKIIKAMKDLDDDLDVKKAEEKAAQWERDQMGVIGLLGYLDDDGIFNLGLGTGIASISFIVLAVMVGSLLAWLRSRSYSHLS